MFIQWVDEWVEKQPVSSKSEGYLVENISIGYELRFIFLFTLPSHPIPPGVETLNQAQNSANSLPLLTTSLPHFPENSLGHKCLSPQGQAGSMNEYSGLGNSRSESPQKASSVRAVTSPTFSLVSTQHLEQCLPYSFSWINKCSV